MFLRALLIAPLFSLTACGQESDAPQGSPAEAAPELGPADGVFPSMMNARSSIIGAEGSEIGTANLIGGPNGILIRIEMNAGSLAPGWHGLHLHQVGDCSDLGVFKESGGHVGKVEGGHGLLNQLGPEGGDIPNIYAHTDGAAGYEAFTSLTTMAELVDEDGSAIIIHANEDDHMTQPIGGAGGRVACGVIK